MISWVNYIIFFFKLQPQILKSVINKVTIMDDGRMFLDQLNSNSVDYKVKVKVIAKYKPQRSVTNVLYQTVVLLDDKGNKMKGTLFGDQIAAHAEALVYNGIYEIANAPIRPAQLQYRRDPTELPYTMGFGKQTLIRSLASAPGPFLPEYQCISQVPKTATPYDMFDVIGTLLYVEPVAREVRAKEGRTNFVREVVLTDHSWDQPLVVSAWNDLAEDECGKLASLVGSFPVIGFTAVKASSHRGFSLTTTMSTTVETSPTGAKVVALTEWVTRNKELLADLQMRIRTVRDPNAPIQNVTLNALKNKKAKNTLQDERYRLKVTVPRTSLQKVNAYLGCSHCGKRTDYAAGEKFKCENCTKEEVASEPRITFNCEVSDGTEQLEITAFTEDSAKLLRMSAPDIFHMKHSEDHLAFRPIEAMLKNEAFTIEVSPKIALTRNNTLQWALRTIILATDVPAPLLPQPVSPDKADTTTTTTVIQSAPVARKLDFGSPPEESSNELVDVSISTHYPLPRNLPTSIPANPQSKQLHNIVPDMATPATQNLNQQTTLPLTTHPLQMPQTATTTVTTVANTPSLKSPKVEKSPTCTPETPSQGTPKRNTARQATASPAKKKKAGTGSSP